MNPDKTQVFHFDLYGKREEKFDFLNKQSISSIEWKELAPQAPNYFFVPKNFDELSEYEKGFSVSELFPKNSAGIVTARDEFTIHNSKQSVEETITEFLKLDDETARNQFKLGKDVRDWQVNYAKKDLQNHLPDKGVFTKISYRPFDDRWTFYTGKSKGFHCMPRSEVMQHLINGKNVGLALCKQFKTGNNYFHALMSKNIIESSYVSNRTSEITSIFPLYLYAPDGSRTPNLNPEIVDRIAEELGLSFTNEKKQNANSQELTANSFSPIDLLDYIYAVLHSPSYRERYKEFLKIDFPRVPYPTNIEEFWRLVKLGGEIRQIHLLEHPVLDQLITQYPTDGDNVVVKPTYQDGKVYINETQYFANVPEIAWNFFIGGYQPAQKWLKDRKDRHLDFEDILHYQKIIVALVETDRIMKAIDV